MNRRSNIQSDIEKIKKLKALQQKATDKLNKIAGESARKPPKKKKPAIKSKAGKPVKKTSFWQKLFGGKAGMKS